MIPTYHILKSHTTITIIVSPSPQQQLLRGQLVEEFEFVQTVDILDEVSFGEFN